MFEEQIAKEIATEIATEEVSAIGTVDGSVSETPSMSDLDGKMDDFFGECPQDIATVEDREGMNPFDERDDGKITLEDGTVIELPSKPIEHFEGDNKGEKDEQQEGASREVKSTRELTQDEKDYLKDTLGWSDKQISKCTIDEDGVIHYKTDREDLDGQTGENGVKYERKTIEIEGVKIQGVFPVFESTCDVQLPKELEKGSNAKQFEECNRQLKERVDNDPELQNLFTDEQLEEIESGETPSGYVWHHNEEVGKMQLVKTEDHDRTKGGAAHTGGKALWGGGYSCHEPSNAENINQEKKI